jgi:hypothetical protein
MIHIIILLVCLGVGFLWVSGIDAMQDKHPDYDGKDLFDEEGY